MRLGEKKILNQREEILMAKSKKCCDGKVASRLGKVGGQAVLEGVMMKAGDRTFTTCRKEDGSIFVHDEKFSSVRAKHKILDLPIIRGVVNFVEMMTLSFKTLSVSAEALEIDDEKDKERKAQGKKTTTDFVMIIGAVLGIALAIGLFMILPGYVSELAAYVISLFSTYVMSGTVKALIEGGAKILIFVAYLLLVSLMPDIKRTFMYHGAEHKSIACFESGAPLTPESAKNYTRFHPRCGTSFMFVMILLGIAVGIVLNNVFSTWPRYLIVALRLLILPLVVGLGYEFIRFAGKHDNVFTRILSAPGLLMQRITTKEPSEDMLEIAIISLKCALRDDFPEFKEFYELKAWEPKTEAPDASVETADEAAESCDENRESADKNAFETAEQPKETDAADTSSAENKNSDDAS